jgi:predicted membrane-bound dolichyl-phosphate-mannose-protein mannosyltransferase
MRWTHRYYPYGPSWLVLTVPLTFIGMNYFLPTFSLFKILMALSFLGSCYLIYKISAKIFPENKLLNVVFFAFNPLVLIESLVSAHNDIVMIFFILLSMHLFLQKKKVLSWVTNLFSIGIKFSTGALFPLFVLLEFLDRTNRKINWEKFFIAAVILSLLTVLVASIRTTFQPWYLVFPLSMAAFVSKKLYVLVPSLVASIFSVSIYIPYVLMTDYAKGYPQIIQNIELSGFLAVSFLASFLVLRQILFSRR